MKHRDNTDFKRWSTDYKLGSPVIAGSGMKGRFDSHGVDSPFVFYHGDRYMMTYIGFDGLGYQTALAESDDLIHWRSLGTILRRNEGNDWDRIGAAGTWLLKESDEISERPVLKKVDGKYWMVYHSYPEEGYECGPAEIGLAWTTDEDLLEWNRLERPVFSWQGGADWERGGLYKACLLEHEGTYYLFYNAKNDGERWHEQTGVAMSQDLLHWSRYEGNPVLRNIPGSWQSAFVSDPCVVKDGNKWVMFYFGFDGSHAQEGLAVSDNLLDWKRAEEPIVRHGAPGDLDELHAHKPYVLRHNEVLYHYYCAVRPVRYEDVILGNEYRTITVAASSHIDTTAT
ncbi:glycoside hydrolase family protein [Cohnella endophytica]|uniref:hypothetical protein n=1 Tax=Cohnella endophytica TaxID=2419778 RepID=UPI001F29DD95|nr:hypothetical protein [Cohnella endophytica]